MWLAVTELNVFDVMATSRMVQSLVDTLQQIPHARWKRSAAVSMSRHVMKNLTQQRWEYVDREWKT